MTDLKQPELRPEQAAVLRYLRKRGPALQMHLIEAAGSKAMTIADCVSVFKSLRDGPLICRTATVHEWTITPAGLTALAEYEEAVK